MLGGSRQLLVVSRGCWCCVVGALFIWTGRRCIASVRLENVFGPKPDGFCCFFSDAVTSEKQAAEKEMADNNDDDELVQSPSRGGRKSKKDGRRRDPAGGRVRGQACALQPAAPRTRAAVLALPHNAK